ncbi:HD-GYP domain-containing protein [Stutzerimonas stutzeri]|uniref:HD-GYP domain-containing protein n=1 Tax=Stutzerimonas stutzeri TaxID=316 RepID=UPI0015E452A3|nr:HD-GYP domain-containing protein [Stutzerimonas stutzeri]MBA1261353.1 HD-GYP domain-containing protein [Stutzerimonas stutzeri]
MLKRIEVSEVVIGMFIHKLCGSWLKHPFWKGRFLVETEEQLQLLRRSAVAQVVIDTDKGLDVPAPMTSAEQVPQPQMQEAPAPQQPRQVNREQTSFIEEARRAQKICENTKAAISEMFADARMGKAVKAENASALVEEISDSIHRHPHALINLACLKTADDYTYMHSVAVCALMVALARQLGLDNEQVRIAGIAGLLHDVGKMAIPDAILNKPGRLSDEEFRIVREHPQAGYRMLLESDQVDPQVLDVVLHHHEKYDGSGYPSGLAGEEISLLARMGAVCDVYDAITSNRAYKAAWDPAESIHRMAQWKGHFDEELLQAFVKAIGIYPIGALVRLESGRIGVVLEQHPTSLLKPRVKVFYSVRLRQPIPIEVIDLEALAGKDRIVCREPAEDYGDFEALTCDDNHAKAYA